MQLCYVVLVIGILSVSVAVRAEDAKNKAAQKPVSHWTCEEFLGFDDEFKPKAVYWTTAHTKGGKPEEGVIDIEGTEKVIPIVMEEYRKEPKATFWQKVKNA